MLGFKLKKKKKKLKMDRQRLEPVNKWPKHARHSTKLLTLVSFKLNRYLYIGRFVLFSVKKSSTKTEIEIFWFQEIQIETKPKNWT